MVRNLPSSLRRFVNGWSRPLGRAQEAQHCHDWVQAEALWRQVVEQVPRDAGAWVQLGNMLNELKRYAEAIEAFRHAGSLNTTLADAPAGVAGVHERAGRWREAGEAWIEAIELLSRNRSPGKASAGLQHAIEHVAMAARACGDSVEAQHLVERAMAKCPDLIKHPDNMAIIAALLPRGISAATAAFLQDFLALLPADDRETAQALPSVRRGDLFEALAEIAPNLHAGKSNANFLRIAVVLYENGSFCREIVRLAEWQSELEPKNLDLVARAFHAASTGRMLVDARRLARRQARLTGELILIHQLAELYDAAGQPARARLLFRFLKRRWPHSRWHACKYIVATAATRSLPLADQLVRREVVEGRRDQELERAFCQSAYVAGHYEDARLRLAQWLKRHTDQDMDALLGYAIANAQGIDKAIAHFRALAAREMQPLAAMVGVAHMAMRKRDLPLAFACWGEIAIVHSGSVNAAVEQARCAYDIGDIETAIGICRTALRHRDADLGMCEFYAWLLTMNGRYEDALPVIATVLARSGPNWQAVDLQIICSSQLGTLDQDWARIGTMMPSSDSDAAVSRFYHVIRILIAVGRRDLAERTLLSPDAPTERSPWVAPYLRAAAVPRAEVRLTTADFGWQAAAAMTRSDLSDRLDAMSDVDVATLLTGGAGALPIVHVVNKFEQPRGGSELHALDLAAQLGQHTKTKVWAPEMPHPEFTNRHGVNTIDPGTGHVPRGGVLVLIGVYFEIARWIHHVQPSRIVFLYNTFEAPALFKRIEEAWKLTGVRPELLYCSDLMGEETGISGRFEPSPTDLELFSPSPTPRPRGRAFTLGRHSRDVPEKHGRDDWKIYQEVAALGGQSILLGGACTAGAFPAVRGMQLLKARSTGIPDFLRGLDAYLYRTSTWIEPWGRVVIEAMACGLPVLVHSLGGYAQVIHHEVNGLLFDTTEEAVRLVRRLVEEPDLRLRLGQEARRSACDLLSPAALNRLAAFYVLDGRETTGSRLDDRGSVR